MTISKFDYYCFSRDSVFDVAIIPEIPNLGILLDEKTYLEFITDSTFIFAGIDLQVQMNVTILDTSFNVLHNTSFGFDYQEFSAKREGLSVLNKNPRTNPTSQPRQRTTKHKNSNTTHRR